MFALYCPRHGHRVLLDLGRLVRLVNLDDGVIVIEARCYDGEQLVEVTGTRATLPTEQVGPPTDHEAYLRPRFSRTRTEIRTGEPGKPNSSRSRRSRNRR